MPESIPPRSDAEIDAEVERRVAERLDKLLGKIPPRNNKDGTPSIAHYHARLMRLNLPSETDGRLPLGYQQRIKGIELEMRTVGISLKAALDPRSEAEKAEAAVEALVSDSKGDVVLEQSEEQIRILRHEMLTLVELCEEQIRDRTNAEAEPIRRRADVGKRWAQLLDEVLRLREWAKTDVPARVLKDHEYSSSAWEASRPGRLMLYVFRSDVPEWRPIIEIAPHHARIFVDVWEARQRVKFYPVGHRLHPMGGPKKGVTVCNGIVVLCPPGHGKTTIGASVMLDWINHQPRHQAKFTHAKEERAKFNHDYVADCWWNETAKGRRNLSLFPHNKLKRKPGNGKVKLPGGEGQKDPTIEAASIHGAIAGANATLIWPDDPCQRKEQDQKTERDRTFKDLTQQWIQRLRGEDSFLFITATIWHDDDAVARLCYGAREHQNNYAVSKQPVGGPRTSPPFFSIWHKMPPAYLRRMYETMADPVGYACQYEIDPRADGQRVVARLALFLSSFGECLSPNPDQRRQHKEHVVFLKTAQFHASLDPAATVGTKSDKAGLVYLAAGELRHETNEGSVSTVTSSKRIRVIGAKQFAATQSDGVQALSDFTATHRTDKVHIEAVSGYAASAEMYEAEFVGVRVRRHNPTGQQGDKVRRLKMVAPMVDDGLRDVGCAPPVVEFPGVLLENGTLIPDPSLKWFFDQILFAGRISDNHCLDALTQVLRDLSGEYHVGEGLVTAVVLEARRDLVQNNGRPEWLREYDEAATKARVPDEHQSAAEQELVWMISD